MFLCMSGNLCTSEAHRISHWIILIESAQNLAWKGHHGLVGTAVGARVRLCTPGEVERRRER